jgi:hypothetical protein
MPQLKNNVKPIVNVVANGPGTVVFTLSAPDASVHEAVA